MGITANAPSSFDSYETVGAKEFSKKIKSPDIYLVDVRTPEEYAGGHIEGAHNLDVNNDNFKAEAEKTLPKDKEIAVYCGSGKRSAKAAGELTELGFKVLNLEGGLAEWNENNLPVVK